MAYPTNITNPAQGVRVVSDLTLVNGISLFGTAFLVCIWLIVYYRTRNTEGTRAAIAYASFFSTIISLFFGLLEIIPDFMVGVMVILMIASLLGLINRE